MAVEEKANQANISISAYIRRCIDEALKSPADLPNNSEQIPAQVLTEKLKIKNNQIERLQSALDQSQQLQALSESCWQAELMQLAEIRSRLFLQRLRIVLVANWNGWKVKKCPTIPLKALEKGDEGKSKKKSFPPNSCQEWWELAMLSK